MVAEYIAGKKPHPRLDPLSIPDATYCEPQKVIYDPSYACIAQPSTVRMGGGDYSFCGYPTV